MGTGGGKIAIPRKIGPLGGIRINTPKRGGVTTGPSCRKKEKRFVRRRGEAVSLLIWGREANRHRRRGPCAAIERGRGA